MKIVTVKTCRDYFTLNLSPEQREYLRKIDHPQDLNEALVSVRHDAAMEHLADEVDKRVMAQLTEMFFGPSH